MSTTRLRIVHEMSQLLRYDFDDHRNNYNEKDSPHDH